MTVNQEKENSSSVDRENETRKKIFYALYAIWHTADEEKMMDLICYGIEGGENLDEKYEEYMVEGKEEYEKIVKAMTFQKKLGIDHFSPTP